jgi:hypothetical protein
VQTVSAVADWRGVSVLDAGRAVLVGDAGAFATWDGSAWQARTNLNNERRWLSLAGAGDRVYAGNSVGSLIQNDGPGWISVPDVISGEVTDMWAVDPDTLWLFTTIAPFTCPIFRYRGTGWDALFSGGALYGVWALSARQAWFAGFDGGLYYNGLGWFPFGLSNQRAVWGSSETNIWAVGMDGLILYYDGSAWAQLVSPFPQNLYDIFGTSARDIVAVGEDGAAIRYGDSGWRAETTGAAGELMGVWASGPDDYWAVGDGEVVHYNGTTWQVVDVGFASTWKAVWGRGNEVFLGGSEDCLVRFIWQ